MLNKMIEMFNVIKVWFMDFVNDWKEFYDFPIFTAIFVVACIVFVIVCICSKKVRNIFF